MDKSVAGFFLPIAVHIICCIINFGNFLQGHVMWTNVLAGACYILFGLLFPFFARRWPFAVTVTAVLAGFLLLSCLFALASEVLPGLLTYTLPFILAFWPPVSAVFDLFLDGAAGWKVMAVFALVWLIYLLCLRRSVRTSNK